ncbi:MAG: FAD:protein FMN transferase [Phycisphaerales bacterium]
MGTPCRIVLYAPDETAAIDASKAAFSRIAELEAVLSDYRLDSEVSRLADAQAGIWHSVSVDLASALETSRTVHQASIEAFDPALGTLTKLWRETRASGQLSSPETLEDARSLAGFHLVEFDAVNRRVRLASTGVRFDFGGIGKGIAMDEAMTVLREHSIDSALIDFGGDLLASGAPPEQPSGWRVSIEDGLGDPQAIDLSNKAIATSGDLEQFVEIGGVRYSHLIDPQTGLGLTQRRAATVIAPGAAVADALASAACVLGENGLETLRDAFPEATIAVRTAE